MPDFGIVDAHVHLADPTRFSYAWTKSAPALNRVVLPEHLTKAAAPVKVEQIVFVERESQRRIVLGEGGRAVKQISMASRKELAKLFERPVHLFLHVKVAEGWENNPEHYREMGLDFPKE